MSQKADFVRAQARVEGEHEEWQRFLRVRRISPASTHGRGEESEATASPAPPVLYRRDV
jgi:hypothetical protein